MRSVQSIFLVSATSLLLGGCFSDDESSLPEPINVAPTASDLVLITQTEQPVSTTLQATDSNGDTLTFSLDTEPTLGTVELMANGEFVYTPPFETTGEDSFTFSVSDGNGGQDSATVNISIEPLQLEFAQYTREAFTQPQTSQPLSVNGRVFIDNGDDDFADLLVE